VQASFRSRLEIFMADKFNPILNNHSLAGKYQGYRSINITGDWRAIFREYESNKTAYFVTIDTHSNLYR